MPNDPTPALPCKQGREQGSAGCEPPVPHDQYLPLLAGGGQEGVLCGLQSCPEPPLPNPPLQAGEGARQRWLRATSSARSIPPPCLQGEARRGCFAACDHAEPPLPSPPLQAEEGARRRWLRATSSARSIPPPASRGRPGGGAFAACDHAETPLPSPPLQAAEGARRRWSRATRSAHSIPPLLAEDGAMQRASLVLRPIIRCADSQ